MERRLAAILAADVVGYGGLMQEDETATLRALAAHRTELIDPRVAAYHGRIFKVMGDGILVEFPSIVEAVQCAVEIQRGMAKRNAEVDTARRIDFRVGVNLGDVIVEEDDFYGDGVIVATRLEGLADAGGICVSRPVRNQVRDKLPYVFEDLGERQVKGIARPMRVFRILIDENATAKVRRPRRLRIHSLQPLIFAGVAAAVLLFVAVLAVWLQITRPDSETKPSIAVLPFKVQGGGKEDEYLGDGFAEDITAALSRFSDLTVLSHYAVIALKDRPPKQISRELGVRYLVTGNVSKAANRMRVSAQLGNAESGAVIWSQQYDEQIDDIFELRDKITHQVTGSLVGRLNLVEEQRAFAKPTKNLEAYDYALQGRSHFHKLRRSSNFRARELFEQADTA